ncbi:MAG TPA: SNF2-related protein, partial [Pirellulales bacterium]
MSTEPQPTDLRVQAEIVSHRGLGLTAETFATGFGPAIHRKPKVQFLALNFASERPRCVSIKPARPKIKTISLEFPVGAAATFLKKKADDPLQPGETKPAVDPHAKKAQDIAPEPSSDEPKRYTRMAPPRDVVKLEDRLYYVLQPPLEAWAAGEQIEFPFRPFPYQFEGIAFLYPRTAALLADEMGLGKTMQTISTMRMLLRSGDVKNILLICPKPLVFNWQREFAAWAPEIPVAVMEGDSAKRKWLWNLPDVPLRIANYELLQRDKDLVLAPDRKFDLVVLDEAQRIKNVNNASAQVARAIQRKRSWAITGTPVENSHEDLVGIFEYLSPGYLQKDMKATRLGQLAGHYVLRR